MLEGLGGGGGIAGLIGNETADSRKLERSIGKGDITGRDLQSTIEPFQRNQRAQQIGGNPNVIRLPIMRELQVLDRAAMVSEVKAKHAQQSGDRHRVGAGRQTPFR